MFHASDDDWLFPEREPSSCHVPAAPLPATRFYVFDAGDDCRDEYENLYTPYRYTTPPSPDGRITGPGGEMAYCHEDTCKWVLTDLGKRQLACELEAGVRERGPAAPLVKASPSSDAPASRRTA